MKHIAAILLKIQRQLCDVDKFIWQSYFKDSNKPETAPGMGLRGPR